MSEKKMPKGELILEEKRVVKTGGNAEGGGSA